jgi:hypothetical protein
LNTQLPNDSFIFGIETAAILSFFVAIVFAVKRDWAAVRIAAGIAGSLALLGVVAAAYLSMGDSSIARATGTVVTFSFKVAFAEFARNRGIFCTGLLLQSAAIWISASRGIRDAKRDAAGRLTAPPSDSQPSLGI